MSESDNTKELDNYGVWVKKPPRTVSSDETLSNEIAPSGTEIKNADTGDNKMEDIDIDSFMDGADFSDGPSEDSEPEKKDASPDGTEEVSLDEFLDGGVFESDDGGSAASEKSEQESKSSKPAESQPSPAFSANDFASPDDITATDSNSAASSDDSPLDIDLSFDDAPDTSSSQNSSEPQFETIDSPAASNSGLTANSSSTSNDGTESIDLSEFGFDIDAPESSSDEKPAVSEPQTDEAPASNTEAPKVDENGMEEVSLDDFDFDINADEGSSSSAEAPQKAEEQKIEAEIPSETKTSGTDDIELDTSAKSPVEDSDLDSIPLDASPDSSSSAELPENDEVKINVDSNDNMESADEENSDKDSKADDDFDLDSIMNSIEDENGEKVSLAAKDNDAKDIAPAYSEEPKTTLESTDDLNLNSAAADEIPDSFDEETASLFADEQKTDEDSDKTLAEPEAAPEELPEDIVEQSEPVFEETSVDLSELPEEISDEEQKTESKENETPSASNSENNIKEISNPFTLPPDNAFAPSKEESKEKESDADKNPADEKISEAKSEKDDEIASSTNAILSQIVSELASLKSEISGLKNEFDELKAKESSAQENSAETESKEENSGFFSGNEDDDTIALSVDELDNILNSAEMVKEGVSDKTNEEPDGPKSESSEIEENISDTSDDLLPDYTDDDADENQKDIFIPKAEEIAEAQSPIDFGKTDDEADSTLEPSIPETDSSDTAQSDDEFSIGDFSFDDDNESSSIEAADEIQPKQKLFDEPVPTTEPSNSIIPENSAAENVPASDKNEEATVDEPFEFGQTLNSDEEFKEPVPQEEENSAEPSTEQKASDEDNISISNEELSNLLAPDPTIEESLTDENLNYLAADKGIDDSEETSDAVSSIPGNLKKEIKSVLSYMDQLLENLPEDKIAEFAQSEQFETYKKLFKELGLDKQQA